MNLSIGIVGLPNVGKSTLFNALTKQSVPAENYPFCTIDPSVGIVPVPDKRLWELSDMSKSEKTVPAVIEFVDIAGLVSGASKGEGLGNQFLSHVRETHALLHVVRLFDDDDITHVSGGVDPLRDAHVINLELVLADYSTVSKRLQSLQKELRVGKKGAEEEEKILKKVEAWLDEGKTIYTLDLSQEEKNQIHNLNLLSIKPMLYGLNSTRSEKEIQDDPRFKEFFSFLKEGGASWVLIDAGTEAELKDMTQEEKKEFLRELSIDNEEEGIELLIRKGFTLLDLISFFTTGEKETRSWTIPASSTAKEAGAAIHTDFRDKFIRADVIEWDKLLSIGSWSKAKSQGIVRTEGKEYIVKDGDVLEFKI